ncbi:hypothetical protein NUH88_06740 [Nisaea acidiphila]|uniref:Uncharacterized protein n=1 Tax=Nisaea acidiphila TaxID=1862145 RepID=A0A9J7AX69_9PROT|nr:DUF4286 family protein [Nisaea acidiphila]UUX51386.1 hypothetical protein NUH88_06740 [Nisaea acidiphila]
MALYGTGMLMTFTEVAPEDEAEFNEWYNREHIDERVWMPGFHRARRYVAVDPEARVKYFASYETTKVEDLADPDYMARLAVQSEWSQKVMAGFTKFDRLTASITVDKTHGFTGWLGVTRFFPEAGLMEKLRALLADTLLPELSAMPEMLGGCLAENDIEVSNTGLKAQGKPVPPGQTPEWIVLLDGATETSIREANARLEDVLTEAGLPAVGLDQTAYSFLFGNNR